MIARRASPLTPPWHHGMPFANAYAMAASTPREALGGALKEALDRALPELREAASRAGERRVAVLLTGQANASDNGPWEWNEATGEWARPTMDGPATCVRRVLEDVLKEPLFEKTVTETLELKPSPTSSAVGR